MSSNSGRKQHRKRVVSPEQLVVLVEFMEKHPYLAQGKYRSIESRAMARRLWAALSKKINEVGVKRTPVEWAKYFADFKSRLWGRFQENKKRPGEICPLSELDHRLLAVVGEHNQKKEKEPKPSPEELQAMLNESEQIDDEQMDEVEFLDEALDTKPEIVQARSLSPPSDADWTEADDIPIGRSSARQNNNSQTTEAEERATRAIESQATSMERMAAALERVADAVSVALERYINNNNGQFV